MVDTSQKRDRNRRKIEKRQDKEFRRKERAQAKREVDPTAPPASIPESDEQDAPTDDLLPQVRRTLS
jgi:hypothetical protein